MTNGNHDSPHPEHGLYRVVHAKNEEGVRMVLLVKLLPVDVERKLRSYLASCRDTIFYHSELKDSQDSHSRLYQLCRFLGPGTRVLVRTGAKDIKLLLLFPFASAAQTQHGFQRGHHDKCVQRTFWPTS